MRIDVNSRVTNGTGRTAAGRGGSTPAFHIGDAGGTAETRPAANIAPTASLDALLALQQVDDPLLKKKQLVRRGRSLLDALDGLREDVLGGRISDARLSQLMVIIGEARENTEPGLDALLDDIELRARVELAKRGFFPD